MSNIMKKQHRKHKILKILLIIMCIIAAGTGIIYIRYGRSGIKRVIARIRSKIEMSSLSSNEWAQDIPDWIDVELIPVDGTSRRGVSLEGVDDIVIHYVGNPNTSAEANREWYENPESDVSSHFIVGLNGEIILCVPLNEKSSATNWRNADTISIEVCHEDESGKFSDVTYRSLVKLTAWLCRKYNLDTEHIIRHYDVTGKICPKYYVEHEDAWKKFKIDVKNS